MRSTPALKLHVCEGDLMNQTEVVRNAAYKAFGLKIQELYQAVHEENGQRQLVALAEAIAALQDAKAATVEIHGGISN